MRAWYCTREDVKNSPEYKFSARIDYLIDQKIPAACDSVDGQMRRRFYPEIRTTRYDYPRSDSSPPRQLWLGGNELISATSVTAGGVAISGSNYALRRWDGKDEAPYTMLELTKDSNAAFADPILVAGLHGYRNDEELIGTLSGALSDSAGATASVTWSTAKFGVGDILRIDSERMFITEKTWVDTTQNLGTALTAQNNNVTVAVTTGSAFAAGEIILIDSERMRVVDVAGNNLTVIRSWDGSVLSAHAQNADIYALTGVQLARGQLGTAAAAHLNAASIYRFKSPALINELSIAETVVLLEQSAAGYARTVGAGPTMRESSGRGIAEIRREALAEHGRTNRSRSV